MVVPSLRHLTGTKLGGTTGPPPATGGRSRSQLFSTPPHSILRVERQVGASPHKLGATIAGTPWPPAPLTGTPWESARRRHTLATVPNTCAPRKECPSQAHHANSATHRHTMTTVPITGVQQCQTQARRSNSGIGTPWQQYQLQARHGDSANHRHTMATVPIAGAQWHAVPNAGTPW